MGRNTLEKLLERQKVLKARIDREQAKARTKERKADTRRKILAGAAILDRAEKDEAARAELHRMLAGFLLRADDRALFGLEPLPDASGAAASETGAPDSQAAA